MKDTAGVASPGTFVRLAFHTHSCPHEGERRNKKSTNARRSISIGNPRKATSENTVPRNCRGATGSFAAGGERAACDYPGVAECGDRGNGPRSTGDTAVVFTRGARGEGSISRSSRGGSNRGTTACGAAVADGCLGMDERGGRGHSPRDRRPSATRVHERAAGGASGASNSSNARESHFVPSSSSTA